MKLSRPIRFSVACLVGWLVSLGLAHALEEVPPRPETEPEPSAPVTIEREANSAREGPPERLSRP